MLSIALCCSLLDADILFVYLESILICPFSTILTRSFQGELVFRMGKTVENLPAGTNSLADIFLS